MMVVRISFWVVVFGTEFFLLKSALAAVSVSVGTKRKCLGRSELVRKNFAHGSKIVLMTVK